MLRVAITTAQPDDACARYRLTDPARVLAERGEIELLPPFQVRLKINAVTGKVIGVIDPPQADVLVMQRPTLGVWADAIPFYQRAGVAVVVELDDDLERLDPSHTLYRFFQPSHNAEENWRHLKRACMMADFVTVSSDALTRYASHGRVEVLRNYAPAAYLTIPREQQERRVVGWGGFVGIHPGDLAVTYGGVGTAVSEADARFLLVGDGDVRAALSLDAEPEKTGVVELDEYLRNVARMDVGIAPLADTKFNVAKTALKSVEYAALGVIPVGSDLPEYRWLRSELGDLVQLCGDRSREWRRAVKQAIRWSEDGWGQELRNVVAAKLTIERHADEWLDAWSWAVEQRAAVA